MSHVLFAFLISIFTLSLPAVVYAQTPTCTMVYGGGETQCQASGSANTSATPTPTPVATNSASNTNNSGQTTKGGLPVYSPSTTSQTPPTGPEAFSLLGLIPAAAAGFWLRKKAR